MAVNHYFQSGNNISNSNEQNLLESMIIECIKIKGFDLYYLPRQTENLDQIFLEDSSSYFDHFHTIEMYLENVDGYGGDGEMLSKFGIELRQTATFTVSKKVWADAVRNDPNLQLPNRPCEGDILYFPLTKSFMEVRRVEHADPFYQFGKLYVYKLSCELYQYSHETFFTGDVDIDAINARNTDELQNLVQDEYGYGLLAENGDYILKEDFVLKKIEPTSDNEELLSRANNIIDWDVRNPFAEVSKR
jgi:hypothetical protein